MFKDERDASRKLTDAANGDPRQADPRQDPLLRSDAARRQPDRRGRGVRPRHPGQPRRSAQEDRRGRSRRGPHEGRRQRAGARQGAPARAGHGVARRTHARPARPAGSERAQQGQNGQQGPERSTGAQQGQQGQQGPAGPTGPARTSRASKASKANRASKASKVRPARAAGSGSARPAAGSRARAASRATADATRARRQRWPQRRRRHAGRRVPSGRRRDGRRRPGCRAASRRGRPPVPRRSPPAHAGRRAAKRLLEGSEDRREGSRRDSQGPAPARRRGRLPESRSARAPQSVGDRQHQALRVHACAAGWTPTRTRSSSRAPTMCRSSTGSWSSSTYRSLSKAGGRGNNAKCRMHNAESLCIHHFAFCILPIRPPSPTPHPTQAAGLARTRTRDIRRPRLVSTFGHRLRTSRRRSGRRRSRRAWPIAARTATTERKPPRPWTGIHVTPPSDVIGARCFRSPPPCDSLRRRRCRAAVAKRDREDARRGDS